MTRVLVNKLQRLEREALDQALYKDIDKDKMLERIRVYREILDFDLFFDEELNTGEDE